MLACDSEVDGAAQPIVALAKQSDHWLNCPVICLNDQPFDQHSVDSLTPVVSGKGPVPTISNSSGRWGFQNWIDFAKAKA